MIIDPFQGFNTFFVLNSADFMRHYSFGLTAIEKKKIYNCEPGFLLDKNIESRQFFFVLEWFCVFT